MNLLKMHLLLFLAFVFLSIRIEAQTIFDQLSSQYGQVSCAFAAYDGQKVWFLAQNEGQNKLFEVNKAGGSWHEALPVVSVNALLTPSLRIDGFSVNADASELFFGLVDLVQKTGDIYRCTFDGQNWSEPVLLPVAINSPGFEGSPSISPDGRDLYFTRLNLDPADYKYDTRFIYTCPRDSKGEWGLPYKISTLITTGNEAAPRIMADGKVLLFSAIREKITDNGVVTLNPKGGYDLYAVKRLGEKTWTLPTHLESYASGLNDTYPSYLAETNSLAFMSGVESKGIYNGAVNVIPLLKEVGVVPIMLLSGKVLDAQKKPVAGDVLVVDPYTSAVRAKYAISKIDGSYFAVLRGDENYQIDIRAAGYTVASEIYNFRDEVLTENRVENKDYVLATEVGLQLNVYDNTIFEPLDVKIDVFEAGTENPTGIQAKSVGAGIYKFVMPIGKSYVFRFSKKSFVSAEMLLDLGGDVFYQQFERDVELQANTKEISINVSDSETEQNMDVDIVVTNLDNNETIYLKAKRGTDGKYKVNLREGDRYEVKVRNPKGYAYYTTQVDMKNPDTQQVLDVKMVKLNARTKLELKAITFEYNSAELKKSSFTELTRVLELLKDNPELKVEVAAHTDDLGTDAYNLKLSDKRAESVMNYLVEQGLVRENIIAKGYGESSPLIPNTDDASRAKNRRVELKILE